VIEMNKIRHILAQIRYAIPSLLIRPDPKLQKDLVRWKQIHSLFCSDSMAMAQLLWRCKEFRNLVIYRNRQHPIRRRLIALFYPPMETLYIDAFDIGGGLYIQHGFATMIAAKSIGENCWINQQVTIGYNGQGDPPVIGDNVTITCGAKVLGDIRIGNNVIVGANAVVIHDVSDNCVVGGVPAKTIMMNN
jgi:serine O-acetyltransferase